MEIVTNLTPYMRFKKYIYYSFYTGLILNRISEIYSFFLKNKVGKFFENGHFKNVQNGEPTPKSSQKID